MAKVKGKNTGPEKIVRGALHRLGCRFRLHRKDLPGSPDIVLTKYRLAIFVHGCFWHRHPGCSKSTVPKTRAKFWSDKFAANISRDLRATSALKAQGWKPIIVWECETKNAQRLDRKLSKLTTKRQSRLAKKAS